MDAQQATWYYDHDTENLSVSLVINKNWRRRGSSSSSINSGAELIDSVFNFRRLRTSHSQHH
jgi:hypothetical protein